MSNSKGKIVVYDEKENEVKSIIVNDKSIRTINNFLMLAVEKGNLAMVKLALDLGADVKYKDSYAIARAVKDHNIEIAKLLLKKGANPNAKIWSDGDYKTCFEVAFDLESYDLLKLLIKYKADVKYENRNPLIQMAYDYYEYNEDIMNLLIENGADINDAFKTCMDMASDKRVVCFLIDKGADITILDNEPLIRYIKNCSYIMAEKLVFAGADVNARDGVPLEEAIKRCSKRTVELLVINGAKVEDKHLALACRDNRVEIVDYFISNGFKLDYDKALVEACKYGANNVIDKLIAAGANAGAYGNEALMHVLSKDSVLIKKLINAGADIDLSKIDFEKIME